jgi:hypothetical protein
LKGEILDKVQAIEHFSDNPLLKNIEETDKIALNLLIKEDRKRILTGSLEGTSDFRNRFLVAGNGLSFTSNTKAFFVGNANNIGVNPSSVSSFAKSSDNDSPSSYFAHEDSRIIEPNIFIPSLIKPQRVVESELKMGAINYNINWSKQIKSKGYYFSFVDRNYTNQNSYESYALVNNPFELTEIRKSFSYKKNALFQHENLWMINKKTNLKYVFHINKVTDLTDLSVNTSGATTMFLKETLQNKDTFYGHFIDITTKLNDHCALKAEMKYQSSTMLQKYILPYNFSFQKHVGTTQSYSSIEQGINPKNTNSSILLKLLGKSSNSSNYNISIGYKQSQQFLGSAINLFNVDTTYNLGNKYNNNQTSQIENYYTDIGYRNLYKKISYKLGINASFIQMKSISEDLKQSLLSRFLLSPHILVNRKIGESGVLLFDYSYNLTNPNLISYYPNFILTDYRTFSAGLPTLANWRNHLCIFNFSNYNLYKNYRYGISAIVSLQENSTKTNRQITSYMSIASFDLAQKTNTLFSVNSNFEKYIPAFYLNFKGRIAFNNSTIFSNLNGLDRTLNPSNMDYQVEISSAFNSIFNTDFNIRFAHNILNINELKSSIAIPSSTFSFYERLKFKCTKSIKGFIYAEQFLVKTNIGKSVNHLMDFQCNYLPQNSKFSFSLDIKNIFDTQLYELQSVTDYSVNKTQYPFLGRWVLLGIGYQF